MILIVKFLRRQNKKGYHGFSSGLPHIMICVSFKKRRRLNSIAFWLCKTSNNKEPRLRQSADVIAHCPLVLKFCTFEGESNDSYVCIL